MITWVDDSDSEWIIKKDHYLEKDGNLNDVSKASSRFANHDELKYCLRSIYKYAPWINHIFIVTDNQVPEWLNENHSKISIIDHKEIIKKKYLPVFNSLAIENSLHKIPKLSEYYLYFNDDFFIGSDLKKYMLFDSKTGKIKIFFTKNSIQNTSIAKNSFKKGVLNTIEKLNELFPEYKNETKYWARHVPSLRKKSLEYKKRKLKIFNTTDQSKFRSETDIYDNSVFNHYWGLYNGYYIEGNISSIYIDMMDLKPIENELEFIKNANPVFFTLNDSHYFNSMYKDDNIKNMKEFLEEYFPNTIPWEKNN